MCIGDVFNRRLGKLGYVAAGQRCMSCCKAGRCTNISSVSSSLVRLGFRHVPFNPTQHKKRNDWSSMLGNRRDHIGGPTKPTFSSLPFTNAHLYQDSLITRTFCGDISKCYLYIYICDCTFTTIYTTNQFRTCWEWICRRNLGCNMQLYLSDARLTIEVYNYINHNITRMQAAESWNPLHEHTEAYRSLRLLRAQIRTSKYDSISQASLLSVENTCALMLHIFVPA